MGETALVLLNAVEAEELTQRIVRVGENLGALLMDAHDGEAWRALGFESWDAYTTARLPFSRRRGYQLLAVARVEETTGERVPSRLAERVVKTVTAVQHVAHDDPPRSEVYQRALAEQRNLAAERGGPAPKSTSRHRGWQPPTETARRWCEQLEAMAEQLTGDDPVDPEWAKVMRRLIRDAEAFLA